MFRRSSLISIAGLGLLIWVNSPAIAAPIADEHNLYAQNSESWWEGLVRRLRGRPRDTERSGTAGQGGANRDRCPYTTEELVAIVPVSAESGIPYVEQTTLGHPTWWFYVPYPSEGQEQAEFVLIDAQEKIVFHEPDFALTNTPGLVEYTLPETEDPLVAGESYRWVFSVICNTANRSGDATVNGWIQRVDMSGSEAPSRLISTEGDYLGDANSLYWFDFLHELNQLRAEDPEQFEPRWNTLLCQIYSQSSRLTGLTETCSEPIVNESASP